MGSQKFRLGNKVDFAHYREMIKYVGRSYPIPRSVDLDVAVDIGCNLGTFTTVNKNVFKALYGFEASFECFLDAQCNVYGPGTKNAFIFNLAAHKESGKLVSIKQHKNRDMGSSSILDHEEWAGGSYHKILTISLEDIFEMCAIDRINYLKIDCEGSEYDFLYGKDLSRIDCIGIEIHRQLGQEKISALIDWISKWFDIELKADIETAHLMYVFLSKEIKR